MFFKKKEERAVTKANAGGLIPDLFRLDFLKSRSSDPLNIATAYSCIRLISSTIASTELKHFKKDGYSVEQETSRLTSLLKNPNPYMSQFDLISSMVSDLIGYGNAFLWIQRDDMNVPTNLWYLPQDSVSLYVTTDYQNPFYYEVSYYGRSYKLWSEDLIHIKNPLTGKVASGYWGVSPVQNHRMIFDSSYAQSEYVKVFYDNASNIAGVIETEKKLSAAAIDELRKNFSKKFAGNSNAGKIPVLPEGMIFKQVSPISPMDANYIDTKKMTNIEVCNIYGVPPSMLEIVESKYSNLEQQHLGFHNYTINPIMTSIEQEFNKKLIPQWRNKEFFNFKVDPLKYSQSKEIAESLSLLRNSSIITTNEAREYYDLKSIDVEAANELKDQIELDNSSVGDNVAQPKEDYTPDLNGSKPLTDDNNSISATTAEGARSIEIEKELHKLKTELGRLRKELRSK